MNYFSKMFTDDHFQPCGRNKYFRDRIGVVLATKNSHHDTYAVNKNDLERVLAAVAKGDLDCAFVVAAKVNGSGRPVYRGEIEARDMALMLEDEVPKVGKYGEFYVIPPRINFPNCTKGKDPSKQGVPLPQY
jgi:hypothetical protein